MEMRHLQQMHVDYMDEGLVLIGINAADKREIAKGFIRENLATFPNVLDHSPAARKAVFQDYPGPGVPLSYIIDREGKVAARWCGVHSETKVRKVLDELGIR